MITLNNLTKTYAGNVHAVDNVNLTVSEGEFVMIMGASGSGKSTLLHLAAGLTTPTSGQVFINGTDIAAMSDSARTKFRLQHVGIVFQAFNLIPTLTAEENICLPLLIAGQPVDKNALEKLLDTLEIKGRRKHRPDALSGGEQQRVAVGRALLFNPDVILADEPTGNLDSVNSDNICKLLRKLNEEEKRTIVAVTHSKDVAAYGKRTIVLKDGRVQQ
ncbi:MAG: ABC transporter ATP-binding protein [Planctomycetaceae bacterium]|jgi:putative ABC transport system ATP-binding protein|nr:ABC transporter ATP-binding protein [Planctomycetaceae bacterium]